MGVHGALGTVVNLIRGPGFTSGRLPFHSWLIITTDVSSTSSLCDVLSNAAYVCAAIQLDVQDDKPAASLLQSFDLDLAELHYRSQV